MEEIRQFDIWTCDFSRSECLEDYGVRPCVIVSNDMNNKFSNRINVVPLTTQAKNPLPTHCVVSSSKVSSFALCENVTMVYSSSLGCKVGELNEFEKRNIIYCLKQQFNIE